MTQRLINFIFIISLLIGCSETDNERISKFENHIGNEHAELLTEIVETFDKLLQKEYNCQPDIECYIEFLKDILDNERTNFYKNLSESKRIELKNKIAKSGLRKDIWEYEFELRKDSLYEEEIFPVDWTDSMKLAELEKTDSAVSIKIYGNYLTGLMNVQDNDSVLISYVDANRATGGLSPLIVATGLVYGYEKYGISEYFLKRIVVVEFFLLYLDK